MRSWTSSARREPGARLDLQGPLSGRRGTQRSAVTPYIRAAGPLAVFRATVLDRWLGTLQQLADPSTCCSAEGWSDTD